MKKRLVSWLLAVCMVVSLLPSVVLADNSAWTTWTTADSHTCSGGDAGELRSEDYRSCGSRGRLHRRTCGCGLFFVLNRRYPLGYD